MKMASSTILVPGPRSLVPYIHPMSPLETLGFALGTSFASGLNLYATIAAAGLFQRFGIVQPMAILRQIGQEHPNAFRLAQEFG